MLSGSSITKVPVGGGTPVRFATDVKATAIDTDAKGDVFVQATAPNRLLRYTSSGKRIVVGSTRGNFDVDAAGNVSQITVSNSTNAAVTTYPASGAASKTRLVRLNGVRAEKILSGTNGTVFIEQNAGGGSHYDFWMRLAAGTSKTTVTGSKTVLFASNVGVDGGFYQVESQGYCFSFCTPGYDQAKNLVRWSADGATSTTTPLTGFGLQYGPSGIPTLSLDDASNLYVNATSKPTPGILKYAPTGGTPQVLLSGSFANMIVG